MDGAVSGTGRLLGLTQSRDLSLLDLAEAVERGLPFESVDRLARAVAPDEAAFKFRLVPKPTLDRRRKSAGRRLTREEGDRLARLAKVFGFAIEVFGEIGAVRQFLGRPHPMLDGKPPLDLALATGPGADAVINLLGRAAYGGGV